MLLISYQCEMYWHSICGDYPSGISNCLFLQTKMK